MAEAHETFPRPRTCRRSPGGLLLLGLLALFAVPVGAQNSQLDQWAVRGVTLLDGRNGPPLENAVIVVDRGRIRCAGTAERCPLWGIPSVIDGDGLWAVPGLIDTHAHLEWSVDSTRAQEQQLVRFALGITSVREAGSHDVDASLRARDRAADPFRPEPRMVVAGTLDPETLEAFGATTYGALANLLVRRGVDHLKVKDSIPADDWDEVFRVARRTRTPVFGHAWTGPLPVTFLDELLAGGVEGVSHLLAVSAIATRDVDTLPAAPDATVDPDAWWQWRKDLWLHADSAVLETVVQQLVEGDVYLEPTLSMERYWAAQPPIAEELSFLGEPPRLLDLIPFTERADVRARNASFERYGGSYAVMRDFVQAFYEAGGTVLPGADEGIPGVSFHAELALLEEAGIPAADLVGAATATAARELGVTARYGTIEAGKVADLLLIEADPSISVGALGQIWRIVKGGVVWDPDVLLEPLRLRHERRTREEWRARAKRILPLLGGSMVVLALLTAWLRWRRRW